MASALGLRLRLRISFCPVLNATLYSQVVHNLGLTAVTAGPWDLHASEAKLLYATAGGARARAKGDTRITIPAACSAIWRLK